MGVSVMFLLALSPALAQVTSISTQYVGTLYAPLDAPQIIDSGLQIYNVQPGGWFRGADIEATIIAPSADWLRVMPSEALGLDVRVTLKTDEDQLIHVSYNGVIVHTKESFERLLNGEVMTSMDHYTRNCTDDAHCLGKICMGELPSIHRQGCRGQGR